MAVIENTNSRTQGAYRDLTETWRNKFPVYEELNRLFSRYLPDRGVRFAKYAWKESVPFPTFWDFDKGRTRKMFQDRSLEIGIYPYELTIDSRGYDLEDDQLGDGSEHVKGAVDRFLQIPQKLIHEYLNGSADLNPSLLNSYDGASLYSATEGGGANRLGASGGNIVTGTGVTVSAFSNDLYSVQQRFLEFTDTAGEILFSPAEVDFGKFIVVVPPELNEVAQQVAEAEYLRVDLANNTSQSNILKGKFRVKMSNLLTDASDWFVVLDHPYWKPFALRQARDVRSIWADMANSDRSKEYNLESLYADTRTGLGPWFVGTTIKVNN